LLGVFSKVKKMFDCSVVFKDLVKGEEIGIWKYKHLYRVLVVIVSSFICKTGNRHVLYRHLSKLFRNLKLTLYILYIKLVFFYYLEVNSFPILIFYLSTKAEKYTIY
jgi:hypothetical protein